MKNIDFSHMNNNSLLLINRAIIVVAELDKLTADLKKAVKDAKNDALTDDEKAELDEVITDLKAKKRAAAKVVKAYADRIRITTQADRDIFEGADLVTDFSVSVFIESVDATTGDGDEYTEKALGKMQAFMSAVVDRGYYTYKTGEWSISYKEIKNRDDEFIKALVQALRSTKAFKEDEWENNTRLVKKVDTAE